MKNSESNIEYVGACPKCGGEMYRYGEISVKLGEETLFFSSLNRLVSGSLTVEPYRCKGCGFTEFYTPFEEELIDN